MTMSRLGALGVAVALSLGGVGAQGTPSAPKKKADGEPGGLYDVVRAMSWDVARSGPLIAVCPLVTRPDASLETFGRKKTTVGGLTAIVPQTRWVIDSRFTQAPNLYDGLPQEAKVLYLLSTLTPAQWNRATAEGIGFADLEGEQTAVFDSILPNPLRYRLGKVEGSRSFFPSSKPEDQKSLEGEERRKVRLRIARQIEPNFYIAKDEGWTSSSLAPERKDGQRMAAIDDERKTAYGHNIVVEEPNSPRKSDLDFKGSRLAQSIPLKTGETVSALLERISATTGLRVVADPHYRSMIVAEIGTSAAAGDVLEAVALGATGTFRRLGGTYILTNDLEGMAAHQARVGAWEDLLEREVDRRRSVWRAAIRASGGIAKMGFRGAAYDGMTEAERANMEKNDRNLGGMPAFLPVDAASPAIREAMPHYDGGNDIDRTKIGLTSSIRCEIVLPEDGPAWWALWLGGTGEFDDKPHHWQPRNPAPVATPLLATKRLAGLALHAETASEATALVHRAARIGVGALWLETNRPEALAAAVTAGKADGVEIDLVLRPWTLGVGESAADPDRTVTGRHGRVLAADKAALTPWVQYWQDVSAFEPPTGERIAPFGAAARARTATLVSLAAVPGLAGVALLDLYPMGYELANSRSVGSAFYTPSVEGGLAYGYTEGQRAAFFAAEGVDPLDLENPSIRTNADLRSAWGEGSTGDDLFDTWQKARGKWAHDAALLLAQSIASAAPTRPILMPGQVPEVNVPPYASSYLTRWMPNSDLPVSPVDYQGLDAMKASDLQVIAIVDEKEPGQLNRVQVRVKRELERSDKPIVLDLTAVPSARLDAVLSAWLKAKAPPVPNEP